uniref:Adiponectin receptor protein 1-like n=1 Tax=Sinocyclocheilus anshuiensis TaxID=1608454 RepID=A0A671RF56_9TELE
MELGPLLEENGPIGAKGVQSEGANCLADDEEEDEDVGEILTLPLQAHHAMEKMEEFVHKVWEGRWRVIPFQILPEWLKDNDYLLHGHRPPMPSFRACFGSIFRIHTETGNIWTHLLDGLVLFNGCHVHHRCWAVCCTNPRALFPGQVRYLGKIMCFCFVIVKKLVP